MFITVMSIVALANVGNRWGAWGWPACHGTKKPSKLRVFAVCGIAQVRPGYLIFDMMLLCLGVEVWVLRSVVLKEGSKRNMIRPSWKCLLVGAVVAVALLSTAPQARCACWGCRRGGVRLGLRLCVVLLAVLRSCYGVVLRDAICGWRPGPIRRLLFGPYRWYGGWLLAAVATRLRLR